MINEQLSDGTTLANMVGGGKTPMLADAELHALGYNIAIHPVYLLGAAVTAMREALRTLQANGQEANSAATLDELNTLVDFESVWALDERD